MKFNNNFYLLTKVNGTELGEGERMVRLSQDIYGFIKRGDQDNVLGGGKVLS